MRRGIKWTPTHPPGVDRLHPNQKFMGYPLRHTPGADLYAEAHGVWKWKWIEVGDPWFRLSGAQQQAVLLHEVGHLRHFHLEKRLALLPIFWSGIARRVAQQQEMQADEFAAQHGYGLALGMFLGQNHRGDGEFYPRIQERLTNILRHIGEVKHEVLH